MAEIHPRTAPLVRLPAERLAAGALVLLAALLLSLVSAGGALAAKPRAASLTVASPKITGVTETSAKLRVSGTVKLPSNLANTAKNRSKVRVAVTLQDAKRKKQSFTAKVDAKRKYSVTRTTKLRGTLKVGVRVRVSGKPSGKAVTKTVAVKVAGSVAGAPSGGGPGTTGGSPSGDAAAVPAGAEKLVGLFRLDAGKDYASGKIEGTYFRMGGVNLSTGEVSWLPNSSSRARNNTFTLLSPGSDGGLRTDRYQAPVVPHYDDTGVLTQSIVQRELFFGSYFTVFTQDYDWQTFGETGVRRETPIPEIFSKDGKLTGQTAAWTANWNKGGLFAQGTPKSDGTLPRSTTPLTGSYDPVTKRFLLEWQSLIVGGPFNGFFGYWHLEGTFEPTG